MLLQQFGGESVIGYLFFLFLIFFIFPRLMLWQILTKLEQSALKLESLSFKSKNIVSKKIMKKPSKLVKSEVDRFSEFFVISPSNIDPYGLVRRMDHLIRNFENRFIYFVDQMSKTDKEEKQKINFGLRAAISVNMLAKIVRHNVELIKKLNNWQFAALLQMQMPLIERIAKSEFKGVQSFVNGHPIGDSIGPLVAADLTGDTKTRAIAEDVIVAKKKIEGKNCFIIRADGPGPRLGRIDEALSKLDSRHKFKGIITIDAKGKLEGEKTGRVVEGVGIALGGPNPQREMIEEFVLKKKLPLDAIGVNVGLEEAVSPMPRSVLESVPEVKKALSRSLKRSKSPVLICGIGNSSGIPKGTKSLQQTKKLILKNAKREELEKKLEEKKPWYKRF